MYFTHSALVSFRWGGEEARWYIPCTSGCRPAGTLCRASWSGCANPIDTHFFVIKKLYRKFALYKPLDSFPGQGVSYSWKEGVTPPVDWHLKSER